MSEQIEVRKQKISLTKFMVMTAVLAALSIVLEFINIPIFIAFPFLKLDISSVASLIGGFLINPLCAAIIEIIKVLFMLLRTYTFGVGELSNLICSLSFVLPPTIIYFYKRKLKWVFIGLVVGIVSEVTISTLSNFFFIFPMYIKVYGLNVLNNMTLQSVILSIILPFNLIKTVLASAITVAIYKPVSKVIKRYV